MGELNAKSPVCADASINIADISKRFGKIQALDKVSLDIKAGSIFALLGPNGSGKTTLVRILTTLLKQDQGTARVGGFDVANEPDSVRPIIGLAGQYPAVDENLTGVENLVMIGQLYHLGSKKAKARALELLETFDLTEAAARNARTYSGGMRRRLDLAAALVANPPILFLDEPTSGLDPRSRLGLWEVISAQAKNCSTVFLTTQYLEEADRLANHIAIMDKGKVLRIGTAQELKNCCGGATQVKISLVDRSKVNQAVQILQEMVKSNINSNDTTGEISVPAPEGTANLNEIVRRLEGAGIQMAEIGLKQPTLDDVFLALTGRPAEEESTRK
ncbi:MAG TPA: ATP-binding cassette domain-containing protein [Dehalococcoidales bacterium]